MQTQWYAANSGPAVLRPAFSGTLSTLLEFSLLALSTLWTAHPRASLGAKACCPRQHSGGIAYILLKASEAPFSLGCLYYEALLREDVSMI